MAGQNDVLLKIAFTGKVEQLVVEATELFGCETGAVHRSAQDVSTALKNLINAINRQRVEEVVELVQRGCLKLAGRCLAKNYPKLQFRALEEILRQCICGADEDRFTSAINFTDNIDAEFRAGACATIYEEMCSMGRTSDVEILLLQSKVDKLNEAEVKEIKIKIASDVESLTDKFILEAKKGEGVLCKRASELCTDDVFNKVVPKIVAKFFKDCTADDASLIVNYCVEFQCYSSCYYLIDSVFKQLKERNMLESLAALHLWACVNHAMQEDLSFTDGMEIRPEQMLAFDAHNELRQYEHLYREKLLRMIDQNELQIFFKDSDFLTSIIGAIVVQYYSGDKNNAKNLIKSCFKGGIATVGRILKTLYQEMKKSGHLATFEAFELFHRLQEITEDLNYKNDIDNEYVREMVPRCLKELLWSEDKKCRIINKYYGEPLFVSAEKNIVHTWVPGAFAGDQLWTFDVHFVTSLIVITHCNKGSKMRVFKTRDSVNSVCVGEIGHKWMIKSFDEDYIKIFRINGGNEEYLTANPSLSNTDSKKRRIQLTKENSTDRQLWQLEFVM